MHGPLPTRGRIAYLAPEIPALSATFVYLELLAVERQGFVVLPFAVHAAAAPVPEQQALAQRTELLYGDAAGAASRGAGLALQAALLLQALRVLPGFGRAAFKALRWLLLDLRSTGPWRPAAWKLAWQWLAGARLARRLQELRCAHLHVHFAHVPAQIAMYASAFSGIPFTVMAHANDIFERGMLLRQKAERARMLLTVSDYNRAHLLACGVTEDRIAVVRCGVDLAPRLPAPVFERRANYRVGTLGRLVQKKGMDDLLRALALLRGTAWRVELSIAGDGPLRPALESLVRDLSLHDAVRFEGALAHAQVTPWLRSLDVFALACKRDDHGDMDGVPVALMEAMSQRVAVLSTRLSGIPELVLDGRTGLLAEPADVDGLARQLRRLLDDPALRARLCEAAAQHVQQEFGQAANVQRLLQFFPFAQARP